MRILHCVLILAFVFLLKNVYCDSSDPIRLPSSKFSFNLDEDHPQASNAAVTAYILAVQWPPGVCTGNSGVTCKIKPVPTEFKIHGLWPQPNGLPSSEAFDANQIATLTTQLNKDWPNLKSEQQQVSVNLVFWRDEWLKHGKFSELGVRAYFEKTLKLFKDVGEGLKAALAAEGIKPTIYNTYKLQDVKDALQRINGGFSTTIICVQSKTSTVQQIQEVRFRFTKDFQKQNNLAFSTCTTTNIRFP